MLPSPSAPGSWRPGVAPGRFGLRLRLTRVGLVAFGRRLPCVIGRSGVVAPGAKREGDGATPGGVLVITGCLYRPDRMARPAPWARPIRRRDRWSDDPLSPAYNHALQAPCAGSVETLWRGDPLYDLVLTTDWNWPQAVAGRGSAIFLHRWRRPGAPTAGCIALAPGDLRWIAARARPGSRIAVRVPPV